MKRLPKLRSIFARKRAGGASDEEQTTYRDIVWENAIEAYESSPDSELEITPYIQARLDAAKHELILKAQRMKREADEIRGLRRRRMGLVAATGVLTLTTVGGAAALTDLTMGVPVLEQVLNVFQDRETPETSDRSSGPSTPTPANARIAPGTSVVNLDLTWEAGGPRTAVVSAFTSEKEDVCVVLAHANVEGWREGSGSISCQPSEFLRSEIEKKHAVVTGVQAGDAFVVNGFAADDVESLDIAGPYGALDVEMTGRWDPAIPGLRALKVFAGVIVVSDRDGNQDAEAANSMLPQAYATRAHLTDGRVILAPAEP